MKSAKKAIFKKLSFLFIDRTIDVFALWLFCPMFLPIIALTALEIIHLVRTYAKLSGKLTLPHMHSYLCLSWGKKS